MNCNLFCFAAFMRSAVWAVVFSTAYVSGAGVIHKWKTTSMVPNTPATAYKWTDASNWDTGTVPAAYDRVEFPLPTGIYYVELPEEGVIVSNIVSQSQSTKYMSLIGGKLTVGSDQGIIATLNFKDGFIFTDLVTGTDLDKKFPYISHLQLAGRAIAGTQNFTPASGWVTHRLDKFATSSDAIRTDDLMFSPYRHNPGSASVAVYAPEGSDACTGEWTLSEGSVYATRNASAEHALSAGTVVSCDGALPSGTYLKRIFSKTIIELSEPATSSGTKTLSFAAFTPDVRITNIFARIGETSTYFSLYKYRPQDSLSYTLSAYHGYALQISYIGLTATEAATWYPGKYIFRDMRDTGADIRFLNADIELAGTESGEPTVFKDAVKVSVMGDCTAAITVNDGLSGVINTLSNLVGTIEKKGGGTLFANLALAGNEGSISVKEGKLVLGVKAALGETIPAVGAFTVSAGAEVHIPSNGLKVGTLTLEDGAVLRGPGVIYVNYVLPQMQGAVLEDGVKIISTVGNSEGIFEESPAGEVVGHPMFWLDASKSDSIVYTVENGTNFVTRWNDCREGEEMFCSNIFYRPQFINGEDMSKKYIRLGRRMTSTNALTESLVWSKPVSGIKAIFLVQDPSEGGGEICGRTSDVLANSLYGTQGGPFYRGRSNDIKQPLVASSYATECVKYGRYYLNGTEVCGYTTGYLGSYMQLVECHINTNLYAQKDGNVRDLWLNAFGVNYLDKNQYGYGCNGCMRIAEYIIYTNSLTHTERVKVAQYLSKKWLGKNVEWTAADPAVSTVDMVADGQTFDVESGFDYAVMSLAGDGEITKSGGGNLFIGSVTNARVTVKDGCLVVRSLAVTNSFVPEGAWIHVDAADPASAQTYVSDGVSYVSKWKNLAGDGGWYKAYSSGYSDAFYVTNAMNGLPFVDLGPLYWSGDKTPKRRSLRYVKADGTQYEKLNGAPWLASPEIRTVFISADTSQGGISLIGSDHNGYPGVGFPHQATNAATPIISATDHTWGWDKYVSAFRDGIALFRTNGVPVDATKVPFSYSQDVFTYRSESCTMRGDALGIYAYGDGANGIAYGELLLYEKALPVNSVNAIEAYMRTKWRGETVPYFTAAGMESLLIENGSSVRLCGYGISAANPVGDLTVGELGGDGSIEGNVVLAAGGSLLAVVDSAGSVSGITVSGSLDLSKGGTVKFTGDVAKLAPGSYPLFTAESILFDGEWTVDSPVASCVVSLRFRDNTLYLNVYSRGTTVILR